MSSIPAQPPPVIAASNDELDARCAALGLPVWRFDAVGSLTAAPALGGELAWTTSAPLHERIGAIARAWADAAEPAIEPLCDGLWLLPLVDCERRRRIGVRGVLVGTAAARTTELFVRSCSLVGVDPAAATIPGGLASQRDAQRIHDWLRWTQADLEEVARSRVELGTFSRQLAESYEEISLLYRLGRSMNQVEHPQKFITLACDELRSTMNYRWIAVRFVDDREAARALTGTLFISGDAPVSAERLREEARRVSVDLPSTEPRVVPPDQHVIKGERDVSIVVQPIVAGGSVIGSLLAGERLAADPGISSVDMKMLEAAAGYLGVLLENAFLYDDQQAMFVGTLEAMTASIDAKDPYTCGHSHRVAELAAALARAHGLSQRDVERVRLAGIMHDVGKIGVPEAVLCKTGRLTDEEFQQIKQHPEIGYQILKDIPQFHDLLPGVLYHHERYDGRGYPEGLKGNDIPLMARIIGLVDSFDAMSSNRTYRSAMPRSRVLEELRDHAGTQFDPSLVESFQNVDLSLYDELVELHQTEAVENGLRIRRRRIAA